MSQTQHASVSTTLPTLSDHQLFTDVQLLKLCTQYGSQAKLWKQKFLGLLPEVERRKLYLQAGCSSVFEFAAKLGGVSREQVLRVLQLHKRFEVTPDLQTALVSGQISVHKLARLASVATLVNQGFLLQQSKVLSQPALETLVRDVKTVRSHSQNVNKTERIAQSDELNLAPDVRQLLLDMQNKGIDHNQVLRELLKERKERIQQEKQKIAEELKTREDRKNRVKGSRAQSKQQDIVTPSRYIPQKVRAVLKQEYGDKCSLETCTNKATNIHHTRRFGLDPSHNPLFLASLCTQHHEIAHTVDVRVAERKRSIQRI